MKVKMQYYTDLAQIMKEVKKLLPMSADWTYELNVMSTFLDKDNPHVTAAIIDSVRQSMYDVDQRLADCQAVINGYINANSPNQEPSVPLESLKEMNEKLQGVASMLQPQEDTDGTTS